MVLEVWRRTWAQSGDNSKGDLAGHMLSSPYSLTISFSIFSPNFITAAYWLLVTGYRGHERTSNAGGRQLLLNLADHSVKYCWSIMPALWQSPKKELSVQSQGQMDCLAWWMSWVIGVVCILWETWVFLTAVLCPSISYLSLWLPDEMWCFLVTHNPSPEVGSLTTLLNTPGNSEHKVPSQMKRKQEYFMVNSGWTSL